MLVTLITLYTIYILVSLYVSVMNIGYINQAKRKSAVLLESSAYLEAGNYAVEKAKLGLISTLIEYALFVMWMVGGLLYLDETFMAYASPWGEILPVLAMILASSLIALPLDWVMKFRLDEKYGFNKSTQAQYIKDTLISTILTVLIGGLVIWGVAAIMSTSELWWLWSFVFIMVIVIAINMLFPTVRALFFDKVTPLENSDLKEKIEELMAKTGFESSGVFVSDASKRDSRLNAYFGGLGKSKRVVLFDTLIAKLSSQELIAVLGHELGHFAHGDLYKNIAMVGAMLFGVFALLGNVPQELYMELGVAQSPHIVMMVFILILPMISFFVMPLMGMVYRHNEYEADRTGADLGGAEHLVNALKKLVSENKSFPLSHPLYRFFHTTHPPVVDRLQALGIDITADITEDFCDPCPND